MTEQQMIEHMVLNVPNMSRLMYRRAFGVPEQRPLSMVVLQAHARGKLESGVLNVPLLHDEFQFNEELPTPLPK